MAFQVCLSSIWFNLSSDIIDHWTYNPIYDSTLPSIIELVKAPSVSPAAAQARLRRVCEMKPSQKLKCPEWMHEMWQNTSNRPDMIVKLAGVDWDKDWYVLNCISTNFRQLFLWRKTFSLSNQPLRIHIYDLGTTIPFLSLYRLLLRWLPAAGGIHQGDDHPQGEVQGKETWYRARVVFQAGDGRPVGLGRVPSSIGLRFLNLMNSGSTKNLEPPHQVKQI